MGSRSSVLRSAAVLGLVFATAAMGFAALAPTASANHDTLPWHELGVISQRDGFRRGLATVLADGNGSFYVFFVTSNVATGLANLNVTKWRTRGFIDAPVLQFERQVNGATNTVVALPPSAVIDSAGSIYVAYTETRPVVGFEVYVSKSTDGGSSWLPEVRANAANGAGNDYEPSIGATPNGNVFVAWQQAWPGIPNITASVSTNGGNSFVNVQNITGARLNGGTSQVSLTTDSANRAYVVFDNRDFAKLTFALNLTWSDDGVSWAAPTTVSGPNSNVFRPVIRSDAGRLHLAWIDTLGGTPLVWYARSSDRGATWTAPVTISQDRVDASVGARTSIGISGGTTMVAWSGVTAAGLDGLAYAISPNDGDLWYAEGFFNGLGVDAANAVVDADENGTFYASPYTFGATYPGVLLEYWFGPSSVPTIHAIDRAPGQLTVRWLAAPEPNVVGYRLWRSVDGLSYSPVASVNATTTSYLDAGLANGTYWYSVQAINDEGIPSHPSTPVAGTVGRTAEETAEDLQAQIDALQTALDNLQSSSDSQAQVLQDRIAELQARLNTIQAEKASATQSYLNTILIVIVIVLLAFMLMQSRKMSAMRTQAQTPPTTPSWQPPSNPPGPSMAPSYPQPQETKPSDEEL